MQGNNGQQGNQGAGQQNQKPGGLSWSQSAPQHAGGTPASAPAAAKPPVQAATPAMPAKAPVQNTNNKSGSSPSSKQAQQPGSGRLVGIFVSGVIVGLIIGWGWFSLRGDDSDNMMASTTPETTTSATGATGTTKTPETTTKPATTGTSVSSGALNVASGQAAGLSVELSSISVSVPTWVAIMDNNNGTPGNALGAAMFFPGDKSGKIDLLRQTVSGKTYLVGEYVDNGDHKFSKQQDSQVTGISGAPMLVEFTAR